MRPWVSGPPDLQAFDATVLRSSSCIRFWRADEQSGTTATDAKAVTNGTHTGTRLRDNRWQIDAGAWFDGTDDYITMGDDTGCEFAATANYSIVAVVQRDATPAASFRIVAKEDGISPFEGWGLVVLSSNLIYSFRSASPSTFGECTSTVPVPKGVSVIGMGYGAANQKLYLNGYEVGSAADAVSQTAAGTENLVIGRLDDSNANYWNGGIQRVAIFDSKITEGTHRELARTVFS